MDYQKIAIIGPDKTGKKSIGREISRYPSVEVIEPTSYHHTKSLLLKECGSLGRQLTNLGDNLHRQYPTFGKFIADMGYGWNLFLYATLAKKAQSGRHTVFIRYPPIESKIYESIYLVGNSRLSKGIQKEMVTIFSGDMDILKTIIYLQAEPENIIKRMQNGNEHFQLHETEQHIEHLVSEYEKTTRQLMEDGQNVMTIDANRSLDEVLRDVINTVKEQLFLIK